MDLKMMDNICMAYRAIDDIDLEDNTVCMMGAYHPTKTLARLVKQLERAESLCVLAVRPSQTI